MKIKFLLVLVFFSSYVFGQKTTFNIKYSEQLAVFVFAQNLSKSYPENVFKTEFLKSRYNTYKYNSLISRLDTLSIDYGYQFEEFPYGSKIPMQTRDFLTKNLLETENLNDFKLRSIGLVPNETLIDLTEIISAFTLIYNDLIYNPNKEKFEKQLEEIKKYAEENDIEKFFDIGLVFYNSSWDQTIPFEIAFYPLPNSDGFTAHAFCNNFISAVQTDLLDNKDLFSVMLHEAYHIIYNEQSLEVKNEIEKNFKQNKSTYSNYAYQLLNEVLATALGNGYVYEKLSGKADANNWYNRKYINLMAKQIYPLVKEYIAQGKPMDKNFIDTYIKDYEIHFPNWIDELDNIMAYRYVLSENIDDFDTISQMFRYRSRDENETEISLESIERMQKTPLTKIIIVSEENNEKLNLVKSKFKELENWNFNADKEFAYKILMDDKSQMIILNQKSSSIKMLFDSLQ